MMAILRNGIPMVANAVCDPRRPSDPAASSARFPFPPASTATELGTVCSARLHDNERTNRKRVFCFCNLNEHSLKRRQKAYVLMKIINVKRKRLGYTLNPKNKLMTKAGK